MWVYGVSTVFPCVLGHKTVYVLQYTIVFWRKARDSNPQPLNEAPLFQSGR